MAASSTTSTGNARSGLRWGGISGIVFVVLFVVGFLMTTDTPDGNASNREWLKYFRDSGNRRMLVFGAASAGLLVITTSVAGGRAGLLSRWLVVTGYVVGVIVIIGGLIFFPFVLFVLWVLAVSIVMLRGSGAAAAV